MRYDVVTVTPELRPQAAELLASRMHRDAGSAERYLEWRFERAPYAQGSTLWLALDGDRVVGMRGCYPTLWTLPGSHERFVLPCFCDTAIDPDHGSRGIFGGIMVDALETLRGHGHRFVLNLSATPVALLDSLATGWRGVGRPTVLRRVSLPKRARARAAAVPGVRRTYRRVRGRGRGHGVARPRLDPFAELDRSFATEATAADDVVAALASRRPAGRIAAACDSRYLDWLLANPMQQHRVVTARNGGQVTACLLLRGATGLSRVVVADWYAESPAELAQLAEHVAHVGRWPALDLWSGACERRELEPFVRAGFVDVGQPRNGALLLRPTTGVAGAEWRLGGADLLAGDAWDVRLLQSPLWLIELPDQTEVPRATAPNAA